MTTRRLLALAALLMSACSLTATTEAPLLPTATTVRVIPATVVPTLSRQMNAVSTVTADVTTTPEPFGDCQFSAGQPATHYEAVANLNYAQHAMLVQEVVHYINRTNDSLSNIVMDVESNLWPRAFRLNDVLVESLAAGYELTGQRLTVDLPQSLEPGCALEIRLAFQLTVPAVGDGISPYRGFFGHSERQLNLGNWLPFVVAHLEGDWVLHETVMIGEQMVVEAADWDVTVNITGMPDGLEVAGPGEVQHPGEHIWQFHLGGARDFTLSLSDQFKRTSAQTESGVTVELYSFDDAQVTDGQGIPVDGAQHTLDTAVKSLAMYEDLYGPYPHQRMVVVEGDFPDGMEFSGLVFVSRDWFARYNGDPAEFLTVITAHEVSHQWWYAAVGSDQAMTPWLDEALATYSEFAFIEEYYPDLKNWWWDWRVNRYAPEGYIDHTVYQFATIREYINGVYLQGAKMLNALRADLGTEAFYDVLRRYYEAGSGRIVSPDVFWSVFSAEQLALTRNTRHHYLHQAGPDG